VAIFTSFKKMNKCPNISTRESKVLPYPVWYGLVTQARGWDADSIHLMSIQILLKHVVIFYMFDNIVARKHVS
jgi:hypothetical protein